MRASAPEANATAGCTILAAFFAARACPEPAEGVELTNLHLIGIFASCPLKATAKAP